MWREQDMTCYSRWKCVINVVNRSSWGAVEIDRLPPMSIDWAGVSRARSRVLDKCFVSAGVSGSAGQDVYSYYT